MIIIMIIVLALIQAFAKQTPIRKSKTPNLPTDIVDFRGFDPSIIFIQRGEILMSSADCPESLSQAMLVGCNVRTEIGRRRPSEKVKS